MMNKSAILYLFVGTGSSMVLDPLFNCLTTNGYMTQKLDPFHEDVQAIANNLSGKQIVLITSDHVFITAAYSNHPQTLSVIELIQRLKPLKTVCTPHDLVCLFEPQDHLWLSLFDVILLPDARLGLNNHYGEQIYVGWARKLFNGYSKEMIGSTQGGIVHFFSGIVRYYDHLGFDKFLEVYGQLYAQGVAIKVPFWPSSEAVEHELRQCGFMVIPANDNHYKVADQFEILITNGASSVTAELALSGRDVIHLVDENLSPVEGQIDIMRGFPHIHHMTVGECCQQLTELRKQPTKIHADLLAPFNMERAMRAVLVD